MKPIAFAVVAAVAFTVARAQAKPTDSAPDPLRLELPGGGEAFYYKPAPLAQRPIVMYLHGRNGDPFEDCRKWARVAKEFGWVVCPSGPSGTERQRTWSNDPESAKKVIDATVAALREKFGGRVKPRGNVLIGFSEGAFIAQQVGLHDPDRWNRWLILAAHDRYWAGDGAQLLDAYRPRIRRVYLFTGEADEVAESTRRAGEMLRLAHIPFRMQIRPGMGHEVPADRMVVNYRRPLRWLITAQ